MEVKNVMASDVDPVVSDLHPSEALEPAGFVSRPVLPQQLSIPDVENADYSVAPHRSDRNHTPTDSRQAVSTRGC